MATITPLFPTGIIPRTERKSGKVERKRPRSAKVDRALSTEAEEAQDLSTELEVDPLIAPLIPLLLSLSLEELEISLGLKHSRCHQLQQSGFKGWNPKLRTVRTLADKCQVDISLVVTPKLQQSG